METLVESTRPTRAGEEILRHQKYPDNAEFYNTCSRSAAVSPAWANRAACRRGALQDRTLAKTLDYVAELDRELKQVDKADPLEVDADRRGGPAGLTLQKSIAANEAGTWRATPGAARRRDQELIKQAIKVEFETLNDRRGAGGDHPRELSPSAARHRSSANHTDDDTSCGPSGASTGRTSLATTGSRSSQV